MTRLDLNARRAARASAKREPFVVRLGTEQFTLVPEMPFFCLEAVEDNKFIDAVKMLVDPVDRDRFKACRPTFNDVLEIIEAYGGGPGGILELGRLLSEHWGAIEADFARYYGDDLASVLWGRSPLVSCA